MISGLEKTVYGDWTGGNGVQGAEWEKLFRKSVMEKMVREERNGGDGVRRTYSGKWCGKSGSRNSP